MRIRGLTFGLVLFVLASGCGVTTSYRPIVGEDAPATERREPDCDFRVVPVVELSELRFTPLGTLDLTSFWPGAMPRSAEDFRAAVAEEVCKAGGDAVVPGIDASGRYVLGSVVLLRVDEPAEGAETRGDEFEAVEAEGVRADAVQAILEGGSEESAEDDDDVPPASDASDTEPPDAE